MAVTWWAANQIRYSIPQVLWLIENLDILAQGRYIPECRESGYCGSNGTVGHHAPFETASGIHAEITFRLSKCGRDGEDLIYQVQHNRELTYEPRLALRYCSGFKRKVTDYQDWKKVTKMRDADWHFNKTRLVRFGKETVTAQPTFILSVS